jgi:hypothetical protein
MPKSRKPRRPRRRHRRPLARWRMRAVRLAGIETIAARGNEPRLIPVAQAIGQVLDDLEERPEGIARARRFLVVHLDGLERIASRLEAGATPPPALGTLLRDLGNGRTAAPR